VAWWAELLEAQVATLPDRERRTLLKTVSTITARIRPRTAGALGVSIYVPPTRSEARAR
jgi:hypothetical protein